MDNDKLQYFASEYSRLSDDELADITHRELVEEAEAALNAELAKRGIKRDALQATVEAPKVRPKRSWKLGAAHVVVIVVAFFIGRAALSFLPLWLLIFLLSGYALFAINRWFRKEP